MDKEFYEQRVERMNLRPGDQSEYDCDICNNKGVVYKAIEVGNSFEIIVNDCECVSKRNIIRNINESGLASQFEKQTLESYEVNQDWQKEIIRKSVEFITNEKPNWFYISGQVGSGKTHICTAISKELIDKGKSFKYLRFVTDFVSLQKRLKSGYTDVREKAEQELDILLGVEVLYIDDLLKVKDLRNLFELIDGRYISNKITIMSSELSLREISNLDEAIGTRIYERTNRGEFLFQIEKNNKNNYRLYGGN